MPPPSTDTCAASRGWMNFAELCRGRWLGPHRVPLLIAFLAVATFTLLRLVLLLAFADSSTWRIGTIIRVFSVGLRFDLLVGLCFVLCQSVHLAIVPSHRLRGPVSRWNWNGSWRGSACR